MSFSNVVSFAVRYYSGRVLLIKSAPVSIFFFAQTWLFVFLAPRVLCNCNCVSTGLVVLPRFPFAGSS